MRMAGMWHLATSKQVLQGQIIDLMFKPSSGNYWRSAFPSPPPLPLAPFLPPTLLTLRLFNSFCYILHI